MEDGEKVGLIPRRHTANEYARDGKGALRPFCIGGNGGEAEPCFC